MNNKLWVIGCNLKKQKIEDRSLIHTEYRVNKIRIQVWGLDSSSLFVFSVIPTKAGIQSISTHIYELN